LTRLRKQASKQTPWRVQARTIGRSLQWLVLFLVLAGMYLTVNARLARSGREVLVLEARRETLLRLNNELAARHAELTTPAHMLEAAGALGFRPAEPADVRYVAIEEFVPEKPFVAPKPPASIADHLSRLSPAYTETLAELLAREMGVRKSGND